ncbi:MAG: hypothetical protein KC503_26605, partial [Myxococcales bacterium]|nr:hypothetical protein [Myxococcales bacterium]
KPRRAVDAETPPGARAAPAVRAAARTGSSVGSARGARLVHRLVLRAGTLTAGGSVALDYNTTVGDASSDSNFHVSISPSFGVFVANGLEVGLDLRFDISTVDTRVNTYTIRGLLRMYLGSWLVAPYIGVAFGPQLFDVRVTLLGGVTDTLQSRFELAPEFGVAVPLRRWVALTFALSPQILFPLSDQLEGVVVALNVSLLGVRAFF